MKIVYNLLLLAVMGLTAGPFYVSAQQNNLVVTGKVIDQNTQRPIPYASIGLLNSNIGTISNEGGGFYISIPPKYAGSKLSFRCVGYKTYQVAASDIGKQANVTVLLSESTMEIGEVVVRSSKLTAEKILKKAVRRFYTNYSTNRFELTAFFRQHAFHPWKEDPYLNLNDYEVRIQDRGMLTPPDSSVDMQILKIRRGASYLNRKFEVDSMVSATFMKIFTGHAHFNDLYNTYTNDVVRFVKGNGILSDSPFRDEAYLNSGLTLDGIVEVDSMMCYKIVSDPQKMNLILKKNGERLPEMNYDEFKRQFPENAPKAAVDTLYSRLVRSRNNQSAKKTYRFDISTVIYVNTADFGIVRYENEVKSFDRYYRSYYVRYQKVGNKYYPKVIVSIHPESGRERHDSTEKYKMPYCITTLIVTGIKTKKVKTIPKDQRVYSWDVLEKVQLPYDPAEWDDQVQIPYDSSIYKLIPEKMGKK